MSESSPVPPGDPGAAAPADAPAGAPAAAPDARSAVEISPFIAWMSRHGHWILFALFASEVLFEGWAIHSAKRRDALLETPPAIVAPAASDDAR